jgi:Ca2+-binding EF-hand superfamily protein
MIRIHSVVLQRKLSYKRLFIEWQIKKVVKPKAYLPGQKKQEKKESYRLTSAELNEGLKQLKCGLTKDEIKELTTTYLPYDAKTRTISAEDFKDIIVDGISTLDQQESYNKMILVKWINEFNKTLLDSTSFNLSYLFHRYDEQHKGGFTFKEFVNMNDYIHLDFDRKDLEKVFKSINKHTQ